MNDTLELIGTTIADKYTVESVVGEGGFAIVYRATHLIWKRPVAIKVFKSLTEFAVADREKLLNEFIQEGALLADLSERSASIVQARDIGTLHLKKGDWVPYMVLEWLEGATLEAILEDEKARGVVLRSVDEAVRLLDPAAQALALAHGKGIAHRDVKPANLFVLGDPRSDNATVKLLDFGIAKVVSDAQRMAGAFSKTSGVVTSFTPAYGAPEQFSRTFGATGPWTDVFALSLIVTEMLAGRDVLDGSDFGQLAVSSSHPNQRPTPRTLGVEVSDSVESVFVKAVAVKPADRYPSAGEFWNDLRLATKLEPMRGFTARAPLSSTAAVVPSSVRLGSAASDLESAATLFAPPQSGQPAQTQSRGLTSTTSTTSSTSSRAQASGKGVIAFIFGGALVVAGSVAGVAYLGAKDRGISVNRATEHEASAPVQPSCPDGMIAIAGGRFFMGSDDKNDLDIERPAHQVTLSPYCIDTFETTTAQYKACSDTGECLRASTANEWPTIADADRIAFDPLCNIRDPAKDGGKHPINCVTWSQASHFCEVAGKRLPTEAEWEFAARGPDGRKYPWGDDEPTAGFLNACGAECVAWGLKAKSKVVPMYPSDDGWAATAPVGSFPKGASRYGVQDVVGNVWEWVSDTYADYTSEATDNPTGPATGPTKVIRGGAWNASYASWVRPTYRYHDTAGTRSHGIGFRCAKALF
jgi:eukaryotic-like serine/threonine-protein kinase